MSQFKKLIRKKNYLKVGARSLKKGKKMYFLKRRKESTVVRVRYFIRVSSDY